MDEKDIDLQVIDRVAKILADRIASDPQFMKRLSNACKIDVTETEMVRGMLRDAKNDLEIQVTKLKDNAIAAATQNLAIWISGHYQKRLEDIKNQLLGLFREDATKAMLEKKLESIIVGMLYSDFKVFLDKIHLNISLGGLLQKHDDLVESRAEHAKWDR